MPKFPNNKKNTIFILFKQIKWEDEMRLREWLIRAMGGMLQRFDDGSYLSLFGAQPGGVWLHEQYKIEA